MTHLPAIPFFTYLSLCATDTGHFATSFLAKLDVVQSETSAKVFAVADTAVPSASFQPFGRVLDLSRAHTNVGKIERGQWVWLVSVTNAAESDLNPIPEYLIWVRAKDGVSERLILNKNLNK